MPSATAPPLEPILTAISSASPASSASMVDLVLSMVTDGVIITDRTGTARYCNRAGYRILGLGPGEALPGLEASEAELYHLEDFSRVPDEELPLARALRGEVVDGAQLLVRSPGLPDGALVSVGAQPFREPSGRVTGAIAVFHDIGARKRVEEELRQANAKLGAWVSELEQRAKATGLMNDMADLLQSCRTMTEFHGVVARFAPHVFSGEAGAMYLVNASRSALEMVVSWGRGAPPDGVFAADGCWALRRGRMHRAGGAALGPDCEHASSEGTHGYTCIPMMGQGEALGILHVHEPPPSVVDEPDLKSTLAASRQRTVIGVAEHIALALANLRLRDTLRTQAIRDPLTGLFNRRYMDESLDRELTRARRSGGSVAALMLDVDHFKRFNDVHGHAAADIALRGTASAVHGCLRPDDIACRYGGEEILIILPDTPLDRAASIAEGIRAAVEALQVRAYGVPLGTVTASLGVAVSQPHGGTADALVRAADAALYGAKRTGRNRVVCAGDHAVHAPELTTAGSTEER